MSKFKKFLIKVALCIYPVKFYGKENIPSGGALFVCNHLSVIDCLYLAGLGVDDLKFLAKKEAFRNKLFAKILRAYGAIPIDRNAPEMRSLMEAIKTLKGGGKLMIFPEGTRNKVGDELLPFKEGSMKMAEKTGCLIIPVALSNTAQIFEDHLPCVRSCKVVVEYGTPIDPKTLSRQELKTLGATCRDRIQEMLDKNQSLIL